MLKTQFDFTIAHFPSLEKVDRAELVSADMVVIDFPTEGGIYHSEQLNWKGDLSFAATPEEFIRSEKERKSLADSKQFFLDLGYTVQVDEVDAQLSQDFFTLYSQTTLQKNRAIDYNSDLIVKKNMAAGLPVYLFGLYKDGKLESGLLVTQYKYDMRVMFGAKKKFSDVRGGIGGVLEMELLRFCFGKKIMRISHGLSTNPAGIADAAGVFEFKTRYGFTPVPIESWHTTFILNEKVALSDLVFLTIRDSQLCVHVLSKESETQSAKYLPYMIPKITSESLSDHIARSRELFHV